MTGFWRSRTGPAVAAIGVAVALGVFLFMDFSAGTGTGAKLFFSVVLGGFAALGAWCFAGIPALVVDTAGWIRGAKKAKPEVTHHSGPLPLLSPRRQGNVRRIVRVMAANGLFVPEVPDPALLFAPLAERDAPVNPDILLDALSEVDFYHPGADADRWMGNLVIQASHGEQDEAQQIADIARLTGDALDVRDVVVRRGGQRIAPVEISMTVNGEGMTLGYMAHPKYLSTHIHHALAVRLRAGGSGKRLAALWVADQGVWLSVLADGAVEALNADLKLGPRANSAWSWVDEEAPFAAGADLIKSKLA